MLKSAKGRFLDLLEQSERDEVFDCVENSERIELVFGKFYDVGAREYNFGMLEGACT